MWRRLSAESGFWKTIWSVFWSADERLGAIAGHGVAVELHLAALVGRGQAHDHAGQGRLAAAGLADQPHRLPGGDVEVHAVEAADDLTAHVEGLAGSSAPGRSAPRRRHARGWRRRPGAPRRWRPSARSRRARGSGSASRGRRRSRTSGAPRCGSGPRPVRSGRRRCSPAITEPGAGSEPGIVASGARAAPDSAPGVISRRGIERSRPTVYGWRGLVEHLAGRALLDQLAGVEHADAVAHLGDHRQVVADEQQRGVELVAQAPDQIEHLGLDGGVQRRGGLVEDQQRGLGGQRHGDHDALEHAARELVRVAAHDPLGVGDADLGEDLLRPCPAPACGPARRSRRPRRPGGPTRIEGFSARPGSW